MKRSLFLILSALYLVCGLYAADEAPENSWGSSALPPVIFGNINTIGFLKTNNFLLLDGTYLNYGEMEERFLAVPENKQYLRLSKIWEVGAFINAGIGLAGYISYIVFALIPDLPNQELLKFIGFASGSAGFLLSINSSMQSRFYLNRAVKNYNLSIMGVPIPVKSKK